MATKSEELIEKPVVSRGRPRSKTSKKATSSVGKKAKKTSTKKKSTKVSKKTNSKKTVKSDTNIIVEQPLILENVENTIVIEPVVEPEGSTIIEHSIENNISTQKSTKRKIKDITKKTVSNQKNDSKVNTENLSENVEFSENSFSVAENISETDTTQTIETVIPKKRKRTLKLTLDSEKNENKTDNNDTTSTLSSLDITTQNNMLVVKEILNSISSQTISKQDKIETDTKIEVDIKNTSILDNTDDVLENNSTTIQSQPSVASTTKKEVSINQNSSFFNKPSIFSKCNIEITNTENDENAIQQETNNSSTTDEFQEDIDITNMLEEELFKTLENDSSVENSSEDEDITDMLEEELIKSLENDSSVENSSEDEDITDMLEEELIKSLENDSSVENSSEDVDITDMLEEELIKSLENDSSVENSSEDKDITDMLEEELIKTLENDSSVENSSEDEDIKVDSSTNLEVEKNNIENSVNSPIGKFFDSSIPSMTTATNAFSKIKKSIFSNISPIFKKFTFEEATLIKNNNKQLNENIVSQENILNDAQKVLENFTPNVTSNTSEIEISAEPAIMTIPVLEKDTTIQPISSEFITEDDITNYTNIITPAADSSLNYDNDSLDEEISDENPDNYDFSNKLIDKLLENNSEIEDDDELNSVEDTFEDNNESTTSNELDYDNITSEDLENISKDEYNDETFSIESYFGIEKNDDNSIVTNSSEEFVDKFLEDNSEQSNDIQVSEIIKEKDLQISNLSKLLESFTQTISTLSDRIADLETKQTTQKIIDVPVRDDIDLDENDIDIEDLDINDIDINDLEEADIDDIDIDDLEEAEIDDIDIDDLEDTDIDINDLDIENIDINDLDLEDFDINDITLDTNNEKISEDSNNTTENETQLVENILSEAFLSKNFDLDENLKEELLSEVLSFEDINIDEISEDSLLEDALIENLSEEDLQNIEKAENKESTEPASDFFKIIESLTKAITELEQAPDIKQQETQKEEVSKQESKQQELIKAENDVSETLQQTPKKKKSKTGTSKKSSSKKQASLPVEFPSELLNTSVSEDKAINILINKDDIFSISILNETYEIVADFDGISVLSENIHISTPKNNFFVKVGEKYIEIHNKNDHFVLHTNFEDIEFANAINNIAFAKKNNKIELNIKEAFKLSSINNKIELSMLNKAIANLSNTTTSTQSSDTEEESSVCDNKTLLISEETQKVYLPYEIKDVMKRLKDSDDYQTVQDVVDAEYTLPLSTFKMPIISRFKEAYRFMRVKEKSSVYAAVDLALELMFNSNLNPAVIRAAKDLKELNIYLDCLYENEIEKFDCFKIIYKILPKIK